MSVVVILDIINHENHLENEKMQNDAKICKKYAKMLKNAFFVIFGEVFW